MRKTNRRTLFALFLLLVVTWLLTILHLGVFPKPDASLLVERPEVTAKSQLIAKAEGGLNHLLLFGSPYERGLATGRLTAPLLFAEEAVLVDEFLRFFPNPLLRWGLMLGAMRWYWGIERYFEPWATAEMYGVAQSAPSEFEHLTDNYTRQAAYHGVHEIGQMFVDFDKGDFGCTLLGVPTRQGWVLGRNFDFDAARILDEEKTVKWVFPDAGDGHAYLSVIWAGMVGAVTGVNDRGVYISVNAAGAAAYRRHATPSTLVVVKALMEADSAAEAVRLIEESEVLITDLYVVADPRDEGFYVIEKTPDRFHTTRHLEAAAVANHLPSPEFEDDAINVFRMREQTTVARLARGTELVRRVAPPPERPDWSPEQASVAMASLMRDKRGPGDVERHLGHREVMDALITTHSVIYDTASQQLWISGGPSVVGPYLGFDLARSFAEQRPVATTTVAADPNMDPETFRKYRLALLKLRATRLALKDGRCEDAGRDLAAIGVSPAKDHYEYLMTLGDYQKTCQDDKPGARSSWQRALAAPPAYLRHRQYLEEALK